MIASTLTWNKILNHISVSQNRVIPGIEFKITDCSVYADGSDCKSIFPPYGKSGKNHMGKVGSCCSHFEIIFMAASWTLFID